MVFLPVLMGGSIIVGGLLPSAIALARSSAVERKFTVQVGYLQLVVGSHLLLVHLHFDLNVALQRQLARLDLGVHLFLGQLLLQLLDYLLHLLHLRLHLRRDLRPLVQEPFRILLAGVAVHIQQQLIDFQPGSEQRIAGRERGHRSGAVDAVFLAQKSLGAGHIEVRGIGDVVLGQAHEIGRIHLVVVERIGLEVPLVQCVLHTGRSSDWRSGRG